ncbi:hypothetical protein NSK_008193 [Nannochloropsis salina CCMP1776]|uniref:Clp ATPase C-terminal domain-containing protein n=1 Tax=Nannochloropsis salina CCMP1776 TaxID=1027361 RepID=A0A4D9CMV9_9STRA|nr:hypothetical protein NSK_008193 [Nannochloropsis salina CCMP1776]|eukprot:TFJ80452.1 hypothetical protein NSK_008193 [Nannochloropsis salina CCMP1776]
MTRLDMTEFSEKFTVSRLIGSPPGYVGYEEGGVLTEAVRRQPYQVLLLDEFEKAHREVGNLLLQVFDDGRLTDSQGRTVDFRNTIIIMTSNLGAQYLSELPPDKPSSAAREDVMRVVRAAFPPEFINRIDNVVLFNRLKRQDMDRIVLHQLDRLRALLHERRLGLKVEENVLHLLADLGYDPAYGARPLKRALQTAVLNPLATLLLEGRAKAESLLCLVRMPRREVREGRDLVIYGKGAIGGEEGGEGEEGLEGLLLGEDVLVCRVVEGGFVEGGGERRGGEGEQGKEAGREREGEAA